ncbi:MAG: hypothetical protein AB4080_07110 [Trichodesmium sp.]
MISSGGGFITFNVNADKFGVEPAPTFVEKLNARRGAGLFNLTLMPINCVWNPPLRHQRKKIVGAGFTKNIDT